MSFDPDGTYDRGIDFLSDTGEALEDTMAVPLRYAETTGKKVILSFDEFQQTLSRESVAIAEKSQTPQKQGIIQKVKGDCQVEDVFFRLWIYR